MKKLLFYFAIAAFSGSLMTSCGNSNNERSSFLVEASDDDAEESTSSYSYATTSSYSSDDDAEETSSYSSYESEEESTDWDEALESYEEFADEYIAFLKKVSNGDTSALADLGDYAEKANEFSQKFSSAAGSMSASQLAKFNRIQQKIMKAASNLKVDASAAEETVDSYNEAVGSFFGSDDDDNDDDDF